MGLFADIIADARRPLGGQWIRRAVAEQFESGPPDEDLSQEEPSSGMSTVFRFQKAESPAKPGGFREASFPSGAIEKRIPAGDPLSVGIEVERQKSFTKSVGFTDITVAGDSRESELETGQEESISPGKIEAVSVDSESYKVRSINAPGLVEAESLHADRKSKIPEGSRQPVSRRSETFESRDSGRGAPSETYPLNRETVSPGIRPSVSEEERSGSLQTPYLPETSSNASGRGVFPVSVMDSAGAEASFDLADSSPAWGTREVAVPRTMPAPAITPSYPKGFAGQNSGSSQKPNAEQSSLVIGRIDVTVVSTEPRQQPAPRGDDTRGFLSRNYLKRI